MDREKTLEVLKRWLPRDYDKVKLNEFADEILSSQWISVEDRLPEEYTGIITVLDGRVFTNIYYTQKGQWVADGMFCEDVTGITHWQPLPSSPPEDK